MNFISTFEELNKLYEAIEPDELDEGIFDRKTNKSKSTKSDSHIESDSGELGWVVAGVAHGKSPDGNGSDYWYEASTREYPSKNAAESAADKMNADGVGGNSVKYVPIEASYAIGIFGDEFRNSLGKGDKTIKAKKRVSADSIKQGKYDNTLKYKSNKKRELSDTNTDKQTAASVKEGVCNSGATKRKLYESTEEVSVDEEAIEDEDVIEIADDETRQLILECSNCGAIILKDEVDVTIDEDADLANTDDKCQYCDESAGYAIVGAVAPYENAGATEDSELEEGIFDRFKKKNKNATANNVANNDAKQEPDGEKETEDKDTYEDTYTYDEWNGAISTAEHYYIEDGEKAGRMEAYNKILDDTASVNLCKDVLAYMDAYFAKENENKKIDAKAYAKHLKEAIEEDELDEGIFDSKKTKQKKYEDAIKKVFGGSRPFSEILYSIVDNAEEAISRAAAYHSDAATDDKFFKGYQNIIKIAESAVKNPRSRTNVVFRIMNFVRDDLIGDPVFKLLETNHSDMQKVMRVEKIGEKAYEYLLSKVNPMIFKALQQKSKHLKQEYGESFTGENIEDEELTEGIFDVFKKKPSNADAAYAEQEAARLENEKKAEFDRKVLARKRDAFVVLEYPKFSDGKPKLLDDTVYDTFQDANKKAWEIRRAGHENPEGVTAEAVIKAEVKLGQTIDLPSHMMPKNEDLDLEDEALNELFGFGKKKAANSSKGASGNASPRKVTFTVYDGNGTLQFNKTYEELPGKMSAADQMRYDFTRSSVYNTFKRNKPNDWSYKRVSDPISQFDTKKKIGTQFLFDLGIRP